MTGRVAGPRLVVSAVLASALALGGCDRLQLDDEDARINYSVGYQVGNDFRRQGVEIDSDLVVRGVADAMTGIAPALTEQDMRKELTNLQKRVQEAQKAALEKNAEASGEPAE